MKKSTIYLILKFIGLLNIEFHDLDSFAVSEHRWVHEIGHMSCTLAMIGLHNCFLTYISF